VRHYALRRPRRGAGRWRQHCIAQLAWLVIETDFAVRYR
jgi:hypothetical protein